MSAETDTEAIARAEGYSAGRIHALAEVGRVREEALAAGFADCEALAGAMAMSLAADLENGKISVPGHAGSELAGKAASWALNFFALALSLGQHRTDEYDSAEILAAHRAVVNRAQASNAGKARMAIPPARRKEIASNAGKARWAKKGE